MGRKSCQEEGGTAGRQGTAGRRGGSREVGTKSRDNRRARERESYISSSTPAMAVEGKVCIQPAPAV